eukprot:6234080-Alexandrium_andersonii.AAC.1
MGVRGVQSVEARLVASVWDGSAAALKQALPVVPQGFEKLVDGPCLGIPPKVAQEILRDLGVGHCV